MAGMHSALHPSTSRVRMKAPLVQRDTFGYLAIHPLAFAFPRWPRPPVCIATANATVDTSRVWHPRRRPAMTQPPDQQPSKGGMQGSQTA